jgi:hypothetical protein
MWSLASARVGHASGAEKVGPPAKKYFFDSIGQQPTRGDDLTYLARKSE